MRPLPTLLVGALGGLLVGVTSVGSGSLIMITLLMLYPALPAVQLVGTDLMQAVPLVLSAAVSDILVNGLDWRELRFRLPSAQFPAACSVQRSRH